MKKRLTIKKVTLRDLDWPHLTRLAGGVVPPPTVATPTCHCVTEPACTTGATNAGGCWTEAVCVTGDVCDSVDCASVVGC